MLITIQFPIADSRAFVTGETHKLVLPSWLAPIPDNDFVRSFGAIRRRPLGGLTGWVGESFICEADNAIVFQGLKSFKDDCGNIVNFRVAFRRFYFDGSAVGKFEIGLVAIGRKQLTNWWSFSERGLSSEQIKQLLYHVLKLPVLVSNPFGEPRRTQLWQAGNLLARNYLFSSTSKQAVSDSQDHLEDWWVQSCEPIIVINYNKDRDLEKDLEKLTDKSDKFAITIDGFASLSHYAIHYQGRNLRVWLIEEEWSSEPVRKLRIFLLRLHAEKTCFKQILRNLITKKLLVHPRGEKSKILQMYLNQAIKRIRKLNQHSEKRLSQGRVEFLGDFAREADESFSPGEYDALLEALRMIDVEKNIFEKVENFAKEAVSSKGQIIMNIGDQYNVGQAGAVGPNAHAHDMVFNQVSTQSEKSTDLLQLAKELSLLRQAMLKEATETEHSIAIGDIAKAEQAAKSKDTKKVVEHLKSAGKWSLDIASKIGVPVAIEALKRAIGIPL